MAVKIVFLHGIGDGDPQGGWLEGLNRGLVQAGHAPVEKADTLAPLYSGKLKTNGFSAKLPPVTYKTKDDSASRFEFARRQGGIQRMLRLRSAAKGPGAHWMPSAPLHVGQKLAVDKLSVKNLDQVRRYVREEPLRGAILQSLLDVDYGDEIVLIGHSLGSVVAIDLLDHLPPHLRVRRFITIGSPASSPSLHNGSERLLKKFPYGRVDDWSNLYNPADIVTGGRGLARTFPAAQDFAVNIGMFEHDAAAYLGHPAVADLVSQIIYPSKALVLADRGVAVRLTDEQASVLLMLNYGRLIGQHIKDDAAAERYKGAMRVRQDQVVAEIEELATVGRQPIAEELHALVGGKLPWVEPRWELHEAVRELVILALTNVVAPYEIDIEKAPVKAIPRIAQFLGFSTNVGHTVIAAIEDVQKVLDKKGGVPWGRVLTAAAGVALVAAGPVGLMAAGPAAAYGGAAIVGGLAAFGPGGMVGGLAMLGGLAGAGAALTTSAVTVAGQRAGSDFDLRNLVLQATVEYARKKMDLPFDENLWYQFAEAETCVSAEINRLEEFSEPKSSLLMTLRDVQASLGRLMAFLIDKGLAPAVIAQAGGGPAGGSEAGAVSEEVEPRRLRIF